MNKLLILLIAVLAIVGGYYFYTYGFPDLTNPGTYKWTKEKDYFENYSYEEPNYFENSTETEVTFPEGEYHTCAFAEFEENWTCPISGYVEGVEDGNLYLNACFACEYNSGFYTT